MKLVHLPSAASLADCTMSLSFVTGKPKSLVVPHTSMSHVSHAFVSQWPTPPSSLSLAVKKGKCCPCVNILRRSLAVSVTVPSKSLSSPLNLVSVG